MWLYKLNIRHPLAILASIVTIVSIAADPAFQQIIHFSDCPDLVVTAAAQSPGSPDILLAAAPRTNYVDGTQLYGGPKTYQWSLPAQSAIHAGVFTLVEPLTVGCPTGNCTFDVFSTAGYCSTCHDVSRDLQFDFECTKRGSTPETKEWIPVKCNSTNMKTIATAITSYLTHLNGTTSSMFWNGSFSSNDTNVLSGSVPAHRRYQPSSFDIIMGKTYFSENGLDPLTGEAIEDIACSHSSSNTGWRCQGYGVANCKMYPCVRSYNVSVHNGVVSQNETHHTTLELLGTLPYWNSSHKDYGRMGRDFVIIDRACLTPGEIDALSREGYNLDADSRWLAYNPAYWFNMSAPGSPDAPYPASMFAPQRQCAYVFDHSIEYRLSSFFGGSLFMVGNVVRSSVRSGSDTPKLSLRAFHGSRQLQVLYNSTDISLEGIQRTFDNIADSLTKIIRTAGHPDYSTPAFGTVLHYAVCLEVNWPWITMPFVLAAGILILLPLTISLSNNKGVPTWKSSSMPLAFRGEPQTRQQLATGESNTTDMVPLLNFRSGSSDKLAPTDDILLSMEKKAKSTVVQLEKVQRKSRLVLVEVTED